MSRLKGDEVGPPAGLQALAGTPQGAPQAPVELVIVGNIARAEAGVPQQRATPA